MEWDLVQQSRDFYPGEVYNEIKKHMKPFFNWANVKTVQEDLNYRTWLSHLISMKMRKWWMVAGVLEKRHEYNAGL